MEEPLIIQVWLEVTHPNHQRKIGLDHWAETSAQNECASCLTPFLQNTVVQSEILQLVSADQL